MKRLFSNRKTIPFVTLAVVLFAGFFSAYIPKSSALSGSDFQAGRIIDNSVFFNTGAINVQQIQEFLNSKVPSCDTNGTQTIYDSSYGDTVTRAVYSSRRGVSTPFTCLKDYYQNIPGVTNSGSDLCGGSIGGGTKSAAQLIYEASVACGINPEVLIVLLQKEQSLVSDDWPWPVQYQKATGYGCPDTAPCDSQYYGFFNQVYQAAQAFKRYEANPDSYNYKANRNNYIYYNPSLGACGGSTVFIQNQATANLYIYTPYQPNAAALANLYGSGDSCSAYGNRNFWRLFNDWFGTTYAADYSWQILNQFAYTDSTETIGRGLHNLNPGDKAYLTLQVRNMGNREWSNTGSNPIFLATARASDRVSIFRDISWPGLARPARMQESTVAPGGTATFKFWIDVPLSASGTYKEYFNLVSEGAAWMPDMGLYYSINVNKAVLDWQLVSQYAASDEANTIGRSLINLEPGDRVHLSLRIRNTGNITWSSTGSNPVNLGISRPLDRLSQFYDSSWLGQNRPARMKESSVAPGQVATFEFWITTPNKPGIFYEYFTPLVEGYNWMPDIGLNYYGTIKAPVYTYELTSQYAYTNSSKTLVTGLSSLTPGSSVFVGFTVINTGNVTWRNDGLNPVYVGTSRPTDRLSPFFSGTWLGQNRPALMKESSVAPGQVATFEFDYKAPLESGNYLEYFNLLVDGRNWMRDLGINFNSIVE